MTETTYTSEKVLSYVYLGRHKDTDNFYIGSRANKLQSDPSHIDLQKYRTSSTIVKPAFDEFEWHIIAEFFDGADAYDFEQKLISENWNDPLLLNGYHHHGAKGKFNTIGRKHSSESKSKMSISGKNRKPITEETRTKMSDSQKGHTKNSGRILSDETKAKISASMKGKNKGRKLGSPSAETKAKRAATKKANKIKKDLAESIS